jgi:hypothetical protein
MLAALPLVPESPIRTPGHVDWLGAAGLAAWLVALLLAISQAPAWGWGSGRVAGLPRTTPPRPSRPPPRTGHHHRHRDPARRQLRAAVIVSAADRADLTVPAIAVTIGILLLWLRARLTTPGHLTAGILLIAVPGALALALTGNTLTAAAGLATAAILIGSALTGSRALASGALGTLPPAPGNRPRSAA